MKNLIWLITISVTLLHQFLTGETSIHRFGTQPPPEAHHSNVVKQPHGKNQTRPVLPAKTSHEIPTQKQLHLLPIDQNSTIAPDIVKIWHEEDSKKVCVAIKQGARCTHPALLGRLSGPALAILEWNTPTIGVDNETVLCGGYGHNWLDAGDYFVEIIILYCNDFGVNSPQRTNDTITSWMEADPKSQCPEDTKHHRITSKDEGGRSMIHVPTSTEGRGNYRLGRWIRKHDLPPRPLFTRYQPLECAGELFGFEKLTQGSPMQKYCSSITDRDKDATEMGGNDTGLYEYEFQWNMKVSEQKLVEKLRRRREEKNIPRICPVGDSHSRYMVEITLPLLNLTGLYDNWVESFFPAPHKIANKIQKRNCDVFMVQANQWPSSYLSGGQPFSFAKYHEKLKAHVQNILKVNPNARVYLPTADQNPPMARIRNCSDWRLPTLMDGYSYVHQMIEKELNTPQVKYVDTNFIINTHWDGMPDWNHLMEVVRSRKTIYMSALMLGETEWF